MFQSTLTFFVEGVVGDPVVQKTSQSLLAHMQTHVHKHVNIWQDSHYKNVITV